MRCENRRLFSIPTSSKTSLPVSSSEDGGGSLRRRLSSMSFNIPAGAEGESFPYRSKSNINISFSSMSDYAGTSLRKWWEWSWSWILSRKPTFATDLEMNEQEIKLLGSNDKGSWRHVFCRVRSEIRRFINHSDHYTSLPQTYRPQPPPVQQQQQSS